MKKSKIFLFVLISALIVGSIGYALAYPTRIHQYEGASHGACHGSAGAATSGTFTVSTSVSGRAITLTASIQGFTEALDANNRSESFSIGIPYVLGDNLNFGLGMAQNTVNGATDYWGVGIWEIDLDSSGNTVNSLMFKVIAPEADGTYDLVIAAMNAMNQTHDGAKSIIYFHDTTTVTVASGVVTLA